MALDLRGIAASGGSACQSGSVEPSHVLTAMGVPADEARGALRLSLGRTTTDADIDAAVGLVGTVIERQRTRAGIDGPAVTTPELASTGVGAT